MDWFQAIDNYCERTDASFWSEPLNAATNLSFLLAAAFCWRFLDVRHDRGIRLLTILLAVIGIGSFLFHTFAQPWAGLADVLPIQAFILVYIHLATVRFFKAPPWAGFASAAVFIPAAAGTSALIESLVGPLNGSTAYLPVLLVISIYVALVGRYDRRTLGGLALGEAILALSLFFRTIDAEVCMAIPIGTHFLWHLLNGVLLGWMICVLSWHGREPALARRTHAE